MRPIQSLKHPALVVIGLVLVAMLFVVAGGELAGISPEAQGRLWATMIFAGTILGAWSSQSATQWTHWGFLWRFGMAWVIVVVLGLACGVFESPRRD